VSKPDTKKAPGARRFDPGLALLALVVCLGIVAAHRIYEREEEKESVSDAERAAECQRLGFPGEWRFVRLGSHGDRVFNCITATRQLVPLAEDPGR
jgi:hypothetical protein